MKYDLSKVGEDILLGQLKGSAPKIAAAKAESVAADPAELKKLAKAHPQLSAEEVEKLALGLAEKRQEVKIAELEKYGAELLAELDKRLAAGKVNAKAAAQYLQPAAQIEPSVEPVSESEPAGESAPAESQPPQEGA